MTKTFQDYFGAGIFIVLLCPAVFGLAAGFFKAMRGTIDSQKAGFKSGMLLHSFNALVSPGVPAYCFYLDSRYGGASSILILPIIPLTWFLFNVGNRRVAKAKA